MVNSELLLFKTDGYCAQKASSVSKADAAAILYASLAVNVVIAKQSKVVYIFEQM